MILKAAAALCSLCILLPHVMQGARDSTAPLCNVASLDDAACRKAEAGMKDLVDAPDTGAAILARLRAVKADLRGAQNETN